MHTLIETRRAAVVRGAAVLVALAAAHTAPAAAGPSACGVFTRTLAATLIKEPPKAILDSPLACTYGRASERAATMRTTLSFTIVRNPSVAAARAVQRRLEQLAPKEQPAGMTGFVRARVTTPDGEATYVYFRQAGGPIVGGFVFVRAGAYTAQLTPQVIAKAGRAFTAGDLRTVAQRLAANLSRGA